MKQGDGGMPTATDDGEKQEASTLRTAAQKRAEKKEREKEKKKKEAAKAKEKLKAQQQGVTETQDETVEEADVTVTEPSKDAATGKCVVCVLLYTQSHSVLIHWATLQYVTVCPV